MAKNIVQINIDGFFDWLRYQNFENNVLRMDDEITQYNLTHYLNALDEYQRREPKEVTIFLDSPGGNAYAAFALYDAIRLLSDSGVFVTIIVEGLAASAAAMIILQAADKRVANKNARFLLHEIRRWVFFSMERQSELEDAIEEMNALAKQITNLIAERCGHKRAEVEKLIKRKEVWMSAKKALDWNLIDEIRNGS